MNDETKEAAERLRKVINGLQNELVWDYLEKNLKKGPCLKNVPCVRFAKLRSRYEIH